MVEMLCTPARSAGTICFQGSRWPVARSTRVIWTGMERVRSSKALAVGEEAKDTFVRAERNVDLLRLSTCNRIEPALTLGIGGEEEFAVWGDQTSRGTLGSECARGAALQIQ